MDPDILIYECLVLSFNVPSLIHQRSSPSYLPLLSQAGKKISKARELLIAAVKSKTPGKIHSNIGSLMREAEKRF